MVKKKSIRRKRMEIKFLNYLHLVELNRKSGYTFEEYPRVNKPLSPRTNVKDLNPDYLRKCVAEEEAFRREINSRNRIRRDNNDSDTRIKLAYERFDREARANEKSTTEEGKKPIDEATTRSLANNYALFDIDCFGQELVDLGVEIPYIVFDAWARQKETENPGYTRRMKHLRNGLDEKLRDYSQEANENNS